MDKTLELTGIGPVVIIDTAGIDDAGDIGEKRVERTRRILEQVDLAVLVIEENRFSEYEQELIHFFEARHLPFFTLHNKNDRCPLKEATRQSIVNETRSDILDISALSGCDSTGVIALIKRHLPHSLFNQPSIVGDLVKRGDLVMLITPIDVEAPKGRLILPQVQTIRDALDHDCMTIVLKERELDAYWSRVKAEPSLVITDSQAFLKADAAIPKHIPLTSFSILFARLKGDFAKYLEGTPHLDRLSDNDTLLLMESCSHHVSCDDIGRVKIPRWISHYTGKQLNFDIVSGLDKPPKPIDSYRLVIQCGGCMLTRTQVMNRLKPAIDAGIPVTNYGMTIAWVHGIYNRAIAPFTGTLLHPANYL